MHSPGAGRRDTGPIAPLALGEAIMDRNSLCSGIDDHILDLVSGLLPCSLADLLMAVACVCTVGLLFAGA